MYKDFIAFVRELYQAQADEFVPLHVPRFRGNERKYLMDCIDSSFVSSVGEYVNRFEAMMAEITGARYAVATVNGTNALHMALKMAGVSRGDLVITQSLSFIATCNAIRYEGADPLFVDVNNNTLGMSADKLEQFFVDATVLEDDVTCIHRESGRRIAACVPMHTFGHPVTIDKIADLCKKYSVALIEDAAESLGSYYKGRHTGTFGLAGTFSFNGNKTVTCGGGGAIVTNDEAFARRAKHLTTQAKLPHAWEYIHDEVGYNYRMPNLNAALACAQLEQLDGFLENKRKVADAYDTFFKNSDWQFIREPEQSKSNYWLNSILLNDRDERDAFLKFTNEHSIMTRPVWMPMHQLDMFKQCYKGDLSVSESIANRLVNVPSSVL